MKKVIKTASLLAFVAFFGCSNNTTSPAASSTNASDTTSVQGLVFNGNSDSGKIEISLASNYLEKVVTGNPTAVAPGVFVGATNINDKTMKAEVKLTGYSYIGQSVDITCDQNWVPLPGDTEANELYLALTGSDANGDEIQFVFNSPDGLYYTFLIPSFAPTAEKIQGPQDEIETAYIANQFGLFILPYADTEQKFFCKGSDGNDYNVIFHANFNVFPCAGQQIQSVFDIKNKIFSGVIEVVKRDSSDQRVPVYFDK